MLRFSTHTHIHTHTHTHTHTHIYIYIWQSALQKVYVQDIKMGWTWRTYNTNQSAWVWKFSWRKRQIKDQDEDWRLKAIISYFRCGFNRVWKRWVNYFPISVTACSNSSFPSVNTQRNWVSRLRPCGLCILGGEHRRFWWLYSLHLHGLREYI